VNQKELEEEAMRERMDRSADAFAAALLKHPMLSAMVLSHMALWKIPTTRENVEAMITAAARHLHARRSTQP